VKGDASKFLKDSCVFSEPKVLQELRKANPFPLTVTLELTERCNLRCPHCYVPRTENVEELTSFEVFGIIDQLAETNAIWLSLTGGEPLLRDDLTAIIEHAAKRRFCVGLKSNATLLDGRKIEELWGAGLTSLYGSLYHPAAAQHDRFVGLKGAWNRTVDAMRRFKALGGRVNIGIVMMRWNSDGILDLEQICRENEWEYTIDGYVFPKLDGDKGVLEYRASKKQIKEVLSKSELHKIHMERGYPEKDPQSNICPVGRASSWIAPNGDLYTCRMLPWKLGNLRHGSYKEIWQTSPVREKILSLLWGDSDECLGCELSRFCVRCPGMSLLETGDVNKPTPMMCSLAEVEREILASRG
jgi:radical SAM protein with 4Fe4S-binding SPASM domain